MKTVIILLTVGIVSGVLGGMGMGGGTLLIPLLSIFCGVEQHLAQAVNLIAFIPMSIVAIVFHAKNQYIKLKGMWLVVIVGVGFAVLGSFLGRALNGEILKKIFGGFLIALALIQFFSDKIRLLIAKRKEKKTIVER